MIEFSKGGTFKAVDNQGLAMSGQYTLSKGGKLRCEVQHGGRSREAVNFTISVNGDELILTSAGDSEVETYGRER